MKLSPLLCLSVAALVLTADRAFAASINLNSSRSNIYRLDPNDQNAAATCIKGGGAISTDSDGQKVCTKPTSAAPVLRDSPLEPSSRTAPPPKNSGSGDILIK
jgi:hypothetical protein